MEHAAAPLLTARRINDLSHFEGLEASPALCLIYLTCVGQLWRCRVRVSRIRRGYKLVYWQLCIACIMRCVTPDTTLNTGRT